MNRTSFLTPEMRLKYLYRRVDELALSAQKLSEKDFDYFKSIGHQIKGNAVTFEFEELTKFGVSLEVAGEAKDANQIALLTKNLKLAVQGYLDQIEKNKPEI